MKKFVPALVLSILCGCQQKLVVPTSQELIANPQLFAKWDAKCSIGEYAHLPAADKDSMCFTTNEAASSLAELKAAKKGNDFYKANILRPEHK